MIQSIFHEHCKNALKINELNKKYLQLICVLFCVCEAVAVPLAYTTKP